MWDGMLDCASDSLCDCCVKCPLFSGLSFHRKIVFFMLIALLIVSVALLLYSFHLTVVVTMVSTVTGKLYFA